MSFADPPGMTMLDLPELDDALPEFAVPEDWIIQLVGMARSAAWRTLMKLPPGSDRSELEGVAFEALVHAAEMYPGYCARHGYDPWKRGGWDGYARMRINGSLLDWCRNQDHLTRNERARLRAIHAALNTRPGHHWTKAELAGATGLTLAQVHQVLDADENRRKVPLPDYWNDPDGNLPDPDPEPEEHCSASALLDAVVAAVEALPFDAQVVVALKWYSQLDDPHIAEVTGLELSQVIYTTEHAAVAIHEALLAAAS